ALISIDSSPVSMAPPRRTMLVAGVGQFSTGGWVSLRPVATQTLTTKRRWLGSKKFSTRSLVALSLTSWRSGGLSFVHMKMRIILFRRRLRLRLDVLARDAVVPIEIWQGHKVTKVKSPKKEHIIDLASQMEVHPALIAGRVRYERGRYNILSNLVGNGEFKKLFV
ncbi:hypothetical protein, partial [Oceanidesulfovibrio indonesiensis]